MPFSSLPSLPSGTSFAQVSWSSWKISPASPYWLSLAWWKIPLLWLRGVVNKVSGT